MDAGKYALRKGERQPTIVEAVDWILRSTDRKYRRDQLSDWRRLFGDAFANQVEEAVKQAWAKKKK